MGRSQSERTRHRGRVMPAINCESCGRKTNSTTSDYWQNHPHKATTCYAAFVDGRWVKGCGFDAADEDVRWFAIEIIRTYAPATEGDSDGRVS